MIIKQKVYEDPIMTVVWFGRRDVITMSGEEEGDITQNQGTYEDIFKNMF